MNDAFAGVLIHVSRSTFHCSVSTIARDVTQQTRVFIYVNDETGGMSPILASALTEKPVCSADGRQLGTVRNLTMNPQTGRLESVLVATDRSAGELRHIPRTPEGDLRISAGAIVGVDDQLVVTLSDAD
ncbi:hypothetical protein C483_10686 [Natrialba hulunbeirensis JCM 10989]|uniref:PRC-barrel domain-containing protein n=2 Tax=Natrialba hulunbeirensis TaxID=123783 RepID=L9ZVN4_9EURY|nr:hypothetical protein C483_10686 [Natrialba hulunbeirensis JCM 10989]